jgi:hypothetical protein
LATIARVADAYDLLKARARALLAETRSAKATIKRLLEGDDADEVMVRAAVEAVVEERREAARAGGEAEDQRAREEELDRALGEDRTVVERAGLGAVVACYVVPKGDPWYVLLLIAAGAIGLAALLATSRLFDAQLRARLVWFLGIVAVAALGACVRQAFASLGWKLVVCERGLVRVLNGRAAAWPWSEVRGLRHEETETTYKGEYTGSTHRIEIELRGAPTLSMESSDVKGGRLVNLVGQIERPGGIQAE